MAIENTTGYGELLEGKFFSAIYEAYNAAFGGFFIVMLFFVIHFVLLIKTKKIILPFITAVIFVGLYHGGLLALTGVNPIGINYMYGTIILEGAGILFVWLTKMWKGGL